MKIIFNAREISQINASLGFILGVFEGIKLQEYGVNHKKGREAIEVAMLNLQGLQKLIDQKLNNM